MQLNVDALNIEPLNYSLSLEGFTGIQWYQCENWTQDENHGGAIGTTRIYDGNSVFGRASRAMNETGGVDYMKIFGYNAGEDSWNRFNLAITQDASLVFPRATTDICLGSSSDTMADKPNDASFGDTAGPVTCDPGDSFALWIRRTITAGTPDHGQYVTTTIQMQEAL
jgi:hypothetical protein